jgi:nucleotide-binding universal stress UspA family protein
VIQRILVPIDFSEFSSQVLDKALSLAGEGAEVLLLHVYEPPRLARPDLVAWGEFEGKMMSLSQIVREEAKQKLDKLVDVTKSRTKARLRAEIAEGRAATEIVECAEREGSDVIVLGTHGREGYRRLVLGSVAEAVVRRAHCSVLTVPGQEG